MSWLPEPIFDRWMAELRGGMYVQGQHCLRRKGKDCCLAVLLDVIDPSQWVMPAYTDRLAWHGERSGLPWTSLSSYGIHNQGRGDVKIIIDYVPGYTTLAILNDQYGLTYAQIASFCEYYSEQIIKKRIKEMEFYNLDSPTIKRYRENKRECKREIDRGMAHDPMLNRHHAIIYAWLEKGCPYYNVWPTILPALTKVDLDKFDSRYFVLSDQVLLLKLPKCEHVLGSIRTILVCSTPDMLVYYVSNGVRGCAAILENLAKGGPIGNGINGAIHRGMIHFTDDQLVMCSRLIAAICLIDRDNVDLLVPDVLASDRDRFERVLDPESDEYRTMVERAARRKGRGFDLGKPRKDETGYVVDAHPMLYHTGPGRKIPRIIVRRGWVSKRVKQLPTGYDQ